MSAISLRRLAREVAEWANFGLSRHKWRIRRLSVLISGLKRLILRLPSPASPQLPLRRMRRPHSSKGGAFRCHRRHLRIQESPSTSPTH